MREERIGSKIIEYYEGRDDKVIYRSMKLDPLNSKGIEIEKQPNEKLNVIKMT